MSTLKTTNLQHPSAASPNVVMGSTGSVAVAGALTGAGMDLVNKTDFSSVSTISFNNVFSSTYDNYRIVLDITPSTAANLYARIRGAGADNVNATGYETRALYWQGTTVGAETGTQSYWDLRGVNSGLRNSFIIDVYGPNQVRATNATGSCAVYVSGVGYVGRSFALNQDVLYGFDGFTLYPSTGTMSGTSRVYGYRNS